jgi:hypothetical protein
VVKIFFSAPEVKCRDGTSDANREIYLRHCPSCPVAGGVEEIKNGGVTASLLGIFIFFPVRVCVHGTCEFQEENLFTLGIDGVPVGSQLKESFHRIVCLLLVLLAENRAVHLEAGETEHSKHIRRVDLWDVKDTRVLLVCQVGKFGLELGRVIMQELAHFSLEVLPVKTKTR